MQALKEFFFSVLQTLHSSVCKNLSDLYLSRFTNSISVCYFVLVGIPPILEDFLWRSPGPGGAPFEESLAERISYGGIPGREDFL